MQITVNDQLSELNAHLTRIYTQLNGDLTPLMRGIGAVIEGSTRDGFRTKTAPNGSKWEDLMPSTTASKKGRGSLLVNRGDLMRSITYHANSDSVAVGTDRPYAKYHQTGTKNTDGSVRMPARVIFGISHDTKTEIMSLLNDFMEQATHA